MQALEALQAPRKKDNEKEIRYKMEKPEILYAELSSAVGALSLSTRVSCRSVDHEQPNQALTRVNWFRSPPAKENEWVMELPGRQTGPSSNPVHLDA